MGRKAKTKRYPDVVEPRWRELTSLRFVPYPPEFARWLAKEVARRSTHHTQCDICVHERSQEFNEWLLEGETPVDVAWWAQEGWGSEQVEHHCREHVLFIVKHEIMPRPDDVMLRPVPPEDQEEEIERWFWWRLWAIGQRAYENMSYMAALRAHELLRLHTADSSMRNFGRVGPVQATAMIEDLSAGEQRERELLERFKHNIYRKDGSEENE